MRMDWIIYLQSSSQIERLRCLLTGKHMDCPICLQSSLPKGIPQVKLCFCTKKNTFDETASIKGNVSCCRLKNYEGFTNYFCQLYRKDYT